MSVDLEEKSITELKEIAKGLDLPGRSKMSKEELIGAIGEVTEVTPPNASEAPVEPDERFSALDRRLTSLEGQVASLRAQVRKSNTPRTEA